MTKGFNSLSQILYVLTLFPSMLNFITLFIVKKEVFEWTSTGQTLNSEEGRLNMMMPSSNVEGTFSEGMFSNEEKVV